MKAIACPQCGALLKTILLKDKFAFCDYCEAKILLPNSQFGKIEIPAKNDAKQLTPWEQHQENYRKVQERVNQYDAPNLSPLPEDRSPVMVLFLGFSLVIIFVVIAVNSDSCLSRPLAVKEKTPPKITTSRTIERPPATPLPKINYEVKVQWSGNNDMEHFENPQIDSSKLPTFDEKELKKTVFKNRGVQVKITIDTNGEVSSAEAISGHPILKEAAVEAARKTLFNSRTKPTSRILTYYFRLIGE